MKKQEFIREVLNYCRQSNIGFADFVRWNMKNHYTACPGMSLAECFEIYYYYFDYCGNEPKWISNSGKSYVGFIKFNDEEYKNYLMEVVKDFSLKVEDENPLHVAEDFLRDTTLVVHLENATFVMEY